ncbi:MAG: cation-transporting P-type ATPase [Patescibacteria group bacterium]|nr:cation-transporting P-type ATPase [Patescibacteria group bacterium]
MEHFISLSSKEAGQKLKEFGYNEIKEIHKVSALSILFRQVKKNSIVYLLLSAAVISFFISKPATAYSIFFVIFLVIIIGFIQEYRAEKAIQALKEMIMPNSLVIRDGKETEIPSKLLVPGDIIILRTGERIPADCLLLEENELQVNESILTGESKEIRKTVSSSSQKATEGNLLFMGSFIISGKGIAKVLATGMNTKFGKIAKMISTAEKELPLQTKINHISKYMVIVAFATSVLTGLIILTRSPILTPEILINIFVLIIALSVSSFPEGFPVVLITTLTIGARRMAKRHALVNRISVIEALGESSVVCTDKTGTITKGEMTVKKIFLKNLCLCPSETGFKVDKNLILQKLFQAAVLCNDARIKEEEDGKNYKILGTPTEGALLILGAKAEVFQEDFKFIKEEETPFTSQRKMMSILGQINGEQVILAKGALEVLLKKCSHIQHEHRVAPLDGREKENILEKNKQLTTEAYRTLGLAYKPVKGTGKNYSENNLIFLGFVAMEDPPREEIAKAIRVCEKAKIKVKMITGDNKETAQAIARQIGLKGDILEGEEIDQLSDEELFNLIPKTAVFARVSPEHKLRIVKILKAAGEIVTMTGDGVNDAPALKEAHIGVAMGINGTDVSRSVADLTLLDNNFATIVYAIKEGRTIFANIQKLVAYELSCNFAELFTIFLGVLLAPLLGWQTPILVALQILFMNLVTDNLPSLTLGFNPPSFDIMRERPRQKTEILNKKLIGLIIFTGSLMTVLSLGIFYLTFNLFGQSIEIARTTTLVSLILLEIVNAFNFRSFRKKSLSRSPLTNKYLFYASVISITATIAVVYSKANVFFETTPITITNWLAAVFSAFILLVIFDLLKSLPQRKRLFLN